jgi:hypothetical protein
MANPIDDIDRQAREGSVAAIIQILNDKLAEVGVRTRAVFAGGVLQLLCEAASAELLEKSSLVDRLRQILEGISPRNIRRVNINSRLVREHQLLWLEEISRDPENQLLWSQEIKLRKPNIFKRLALARKDGQARRSGKLVLPRTAPPRPLRDQRQFQRGIAGGVTLSAVLIAAVTAIYRGINFSSVPNNRTNQAVVTSTSETEATVQKISQQTAAPTSKTSDSFAQAVRLAEQAVNSGKTARSREDWLVVAVKWQQAADLMAAVPASHPRYATAANRSALYRENSEKAQKEAQNK